MFGQALTAAAMNAQLTVLPTFADNISHIKYFGFVEVVYFDQFLGAAH